MTQEQLAALIQEVGLGHIEETLMSAARPSLRLHLHPVDEDTLPIGATKFGGGADLPPDFEWPVWQGYPESDRPRYRPGEFFAQDGPQEFLLQIRLEDLAAYDLGGVLPSTGILYFFCATWKAALGYDDSDSDCWRVFHYDGEPSLLTRQPKFPSGGTYTDQPLTCLRIEFEPDVTLPEFNDPVTYEALRLSKNEAECYNELFIRLGSEGDNGGQPSYVGPIHRLLGLPQIVQYDRIVGTNYVPGHDQGWSLLLQLDTEDITGAKMPDAVTVQWQGGGRGYFYIPTQALAERNFDAVWVDMQCT